MLLFVKVCIALTLCVPGAVCCAQAVCPADAVFLALNTEVRGFSLRANGTVTPCQVLVEASNVAWGLIAIGLDASLHLSGFQNSTPKGIGPVDIFPAFASGSAAPIRTALTFAKDHISLATDRRGNDFVLATESVIFLPNGATGEPSPYIVIPAANVTSIASDRDGNLLMAGWDAYGNVFINTMGTSLSKSSPPLLRTLSGSATGLFTAPLSFWGNQAHLQIALDPVSEELYVYNASADLSRNEVAIFAPRASGDVRPLRTISGPATGIGMPSGIGGNKIAVSCDGRLFVSEPVRRVLVFAPGADGNVTPSQVIQDASAGSTFLSAQGGVAVRSCIKPPIPILGNPLHANPR